MPRVVSWSTLCVLGTLSATPQLSANSITASPNPCTIPAGQSNCHDSGEAVDIRVDGDDPYTVIYDKVVIERFINIAKENCLSCDRKAKGTGNEHFHCVTDTPCVPYP